MKGKEVKIGLSIIGVLLCVFGAVLFNRLRHGDEGDAVAAKNASKDTEKNKGGVKKKSDGASQSRDATAESASGANAGPKLKGSSAAKRSSPGFSSRGAEQSKSRDPWSAHSSSASSGGRYQDTSQDQEQPDSDRYGRNYHAATDNSQSNDSPSSDSNAAYAVESAEPTFDGEMPAETSDPSEGGPAFQPAGDLAGAQPADGYQNLADSSDDRTAGEAAADPFPSATQAMPAHRGLPIGSALKSSPAEVQLTPIEAADEEPLQASHDAEFDKTDDAEALNDATSQFPPTDRGLAEERAGGEGVYFVEANDNFATISKKVYGTEGYFKALHEYNREQYPNPNLIDPGDEIATPDVAVLEQNYPKLCPKRRNAPAEPREGAMRLASDANTGRGGRTYLVAEGDTLFDIAKRELGKASRWREIYDLNQDQLGADFNYLSPGTQLRLPGSGEKPDPVADRRYLDRANRRR